MPIPVYKAEREAGLAEMVRTSGSITYAATIEQVSVEELTKANALASAQKQLEISQATNLGQIDLYYMKSILATAGWNKNDDVFDRVETWMARATPEDKPFNMRHDPAEIIGHITGNYAVDESLAVIANDIPVDDLPDKYHIVSSAVLYRFLKCPKPELEQKMEKIIAEIPKGVWFVSMEALFSNFDYAVVGSDGKNRVLPRNEESAFLTKHLRAYGGAGVYEDYKIGRLMRNIVFTGKGLVEQPANPESIIFRDVATFKTNAGYLPISKNASQGKHKESRVMATEIELQAQNKSLEASLVAAQKQNEDLTKRLNETNEKQVQAKIADLEGQVKAREEKITSLTAQVKTEQEARLSAEENAKKVTTELDTLKTDLAKVKAEQTVANRISRWVEHTGAETAVATKTVEKLVKLDDAEFDDFLKTQPAKTAAKADDKNDQVDKKMLDNAQADKKEPPLVTGAGVNTDIEATRAKLGAFIGQNFLGRKPKTEQKDS